MEAVLAREALSRTSLRSESLIREVEDCYLGGSLITKVGLVNEVPQADSLGSTREATGAMTHTSYGVCCQARHSHTADYNKEKSIWNMY